MTFKHNDSPEKFLKHLSGRIEQYCERIKTGDLNEAFASLDLLVSIFSAFEGGIEQDDLKQAYPIRLWREDTVEVPKALLRPIVAGWIAYRDGEEALSLGVAMGVEPKGRGRKPTRSRARTLDREQHLSNQVVLDLVASELEGRPVSQDAAIFGVSERESVPYETVRAAFKKHGKTTRKKLGRYGV